MELDGPPSVDGPPTSKTLSVDGPPGGRNSLIKLSRLLKLVAPFIFQWRILNPGLPRLCLNMHRESGYHDVAPQSLMT